MMNALVHARANDRTARERPRARILYFSEHPSPRARPRVVARVARTIGLTRRGKADGARARARVRSRESPRHESRLVVVVDTYMGVCVSRIRCVCVEETAY